MSEWTPDSCQAIRTDQDLDGLEDGCELGLARAFAPLLILSGRSCNAATGAPPGGYAFTVAPRDSGHAILINYAPAYRLDCGWSGPKCWLRWRGGCRGHRGDSEFISLRIGFDTATGRWSTESVFLSAHCFGTLDSDCRWYGGSDLDQFQWEGAARSVPLVWVAEGKNANYPSKARCERGHLWFDTCERNTVRERFPILSASQNIGEPLRRSAARRGGAETCFTLNNLGWAGPATVEDSAVVECFGGSESFTGWFNEERSDPNGDAYSFGSTPYVRYFRLALEGPASVGELDPGNDAGRPTPMHP